MKKYNLLLITLLLSCTILSCRQNPQLQSPTDDPSSSWRGVFISYWQGMNHSYSFWDIDPTDWDKVYDEYLPKFEALDELAEGSFEESKALFEELTSTLIDHHYSLKVKHNGKEYYVIPADKEIQTRDYYHEKTMEYFRAPVVTNKNSGRISHMLSETWLDSNDTQVSMASYIIDEIAYLYISDFMLNELIFDPVKYAKQQGILNQFWSMADTPGIKGAIVDVRGNGGGYLSDLQILLGRFITQPLHIGYTKHKNGMGRLDYSPFEPAFLYPIEGGIDLQVPIVVLSDLHSVSMAEMTSRTIGLMPTGCHIGERTYGGQGPLNNDFKQYFSGSFENKAYKVYTSSHILYNLDKVSTEGYGIMPQIVVLTDIEELKTGYDRQLERAIEYIETGK